MPDLLPTIEVLRDLFDNIDVYEAEPIAGDVTPTLVQEMVKLIFAILANADVEGNDNDVTMGIREVQRAYDRVTVNRILRRLAITCMEEVEEDE